MPNRLIMAVGAVCCAAGLGCAAFNIGFGIAGSRNPAAAKDVGTGLMLSIAVGLWGIFALQLRQRP